MSGFSLKGANLEGINLVNYQGHDGFDLSYADLYRTNLKGAHLFRVDFHRASLMKADLHMANLHCANLKDANLLGINLRRAKIDHIKWGDNILQEKQAIQAEKQGVLDQAKDYFEQSEEIYRILRKANEEQGLFETAGNFFYREIVMRRRQLPYYSLRRLFSKIVDLFCGYGEKPMRVVLFSLLLIISCSFLYFGIGIEFHNQIIAFNIHSSLTQNLLNYAQCMYFSAVTFTTLGYGDFIPLGIVRPIAAIEAFTGSFTIALYVVVFVRKMTY